MKKILTYFTLALFLLFTDTSGSAQAAAEKNPQAQSGTLEKVTVGTGSVSMNLDLSRLNGGRDSQLDFQIGPNSLFSLLVFNNVLRGADAGSIGLISRNTAPLPEALQASLNQLVVEKLASDAAYDLAVRDGKSGFVFFNIEGNTYDYDAAARLLTIKGGRLLISEEFAKILGRPANAGSVIGGISIGATVYPIEITTVVNGQVQSATLPRGGAAPNTPTFVAGPDVIVGDLPSMAQFGSSGTINGVALGIVGLAVGTTSCNNGTVDLNWFAMPNTDHPVIPQNFYRMSGGATNSERFEQIGQSWLKHAFTALTGNECGFGCNGVGGSHLGSGCSDPYGAGLNAGQSGLGSRAWVNPFTGFYTSAARDHTGHNDVDTEPTHRALVPMSDLAPSQNPGATYFAEAQYVSPHEYTWCQSHPGECNMYNNASYRQFTPSGTTSFTFSMVGATVRTMPAISAWTGATINTVEPAPGVDGRAFIAYKVTNPSAGIWHYEYAVNNQNLDRSIQSFSVPLGCGISVSNVGFHAPMNHPGIANDGTPNSAGYSNSPWTPNQTGTAMKWSSETFAQNQNANAIRWGTLYNFRFDSNRPPQVANATVGFFKTGAPITVAIQGPAAGPCTPLTLSTAVSRKTHAGAGVLDLNLPLSGTPGVESRSGGAGGNYTVVFTFANNVVSGNASVTSGTGSVAGSPTFAANTMTVNLTGVGNAQTIVLNLSSVTDEFSQTLADTPLSVSFLFGDTNGDRAVNSGDALQTRNRSGQPADATNFLSDVNVDGLVNSGDTTAVRAQSGNSVP